MNEKMILWYFPCFLPSFPKVDFRLSGLWAKKPRKFQSSKSKLPIAITLILDKSKFKLNVKFREIADRYAVRQVKKLEQWFLESIFVFVVVLKCALWLSNFGTEHNARFPFRPESLQYL